MLGVSEVEFNVLLGENINVTLLKNYGEDICNPTSTELTNNCFTGLSAGDNPEVLFTNLIPLTSYLMAIWTDETKQTDFEVCLARAPFYECGDNICYPLAENYTNCPQDCIRTSVEDQLNSLQIFPNPVVNKIYISFKDFTLPNVQIRIYSIDGKVWFKQNIGNRSESYNLNVNHLPEGMYGLQIYSDKINHSQKFLKIEYN